MKRLYFISVIIIVSCGSPNGNLYEIDPTSFVENKITLAEIADDVHYILLDDSIPIVSFKYIVTSDNIYIAAKDVGILKYDRQGRLIKKIGSKGRGPDELIYGIDFIVDDITGNVFVIDPDKIKTYSPNGNFLRDISLEGYFDDRPIPDEIEIFNSLLFLADYVRRGDSKYYWIFLDTLGNLVSVKKNSIPPFETNWVEDGSIYKFHNKLFYYNLFNDTIFSIYPDLSYKGEYLFAKGDHRRSRSKIEYNSFSQVQAALYTLFMTHDMFETKHFIIFSYNYLERHALCLIEKETKKTFILYKYAEFPQSLVKSIGSIVNNIDGGIPLTYLQYYNENDNEYITTLINAFNLKAYISSDDFKNSTPKYPEKKEELKKLAASLKETDNPVLVLVRLKE